jgi:hypothetical protein
MAYVLSNDLSGIPPEINQRLRKTLLHCGPFASDNQLRAVFVDQRISAWREFLPSAPSPTERAEAVIHFLHNQFASTQENVLVLLLHVLRDRRNPGDACHEQLNTLATDLTQAQEQIHVALQNKGPMAPALPPKTYDHFSGRTQELEQLTANLCNLEKYPLIALYGIGGIGKTALAREAIERTIQEERFWHIVWISAKTTRFEGTGIQQLAVSDMSFEGVLNDIANQCHLPHLLTQPLDQKQRNLQQFLARHPTLIGLDNLETVPEREDLVFRVKDMTTGPSKVLVTSRFHLRKVDVHPYTLEGLPSDEALTFLRMEGRSQGIPEMAKAPDDVLLRLHTATGGVPLAMKLVVGQLKRYPLEKVLHNLQKVSLQEEELAFYEFMFKGSWDMLSPEAKEVLLSMSDCDPEIGDSPDMVRAIAEAPPDAFDAAMVELIVMSLVNLVGPLGNRRYTLHPLTYNLIHSDVVQNWEV